jgi:hypothetical protein
MKVTGKEVIFLSLCFCRSRDLFSLPHLQDRIHLMTTAENSEVTCYFGTPPECESGIGHCTFLLASIDGATVLFAESGSNVGGSDG